MKMKNNVSGKTYTIAQIFRDDSGYFRVLYFDPEANRWANRKPQLLYSSRKLTKIKKGKEQWILITVVIL